MKTLLSNTLRLSTILIFLLLVSHQNKACTTVSCIAPNGHVWNANNEDGPFKVANFINVYPQQENQPLGYYTLSYLSPRYGQTGQIQGGMNEAGLTFDFDAIDEPKGFDLSQKMTFPDGDDAILTHILGTMHSVEEVISFFDKYWFQNGFTTAQMHVADQEGNFAIISASGVLRAPQGEHLVSTNFDVIAGDIDPDCWRYALATELLEEQLINFETMQKLCKETAPRNGRNMYANIQNLSTGEVWLFSKHDPDILVHTSIQQLLKQGKRSYSFSHLEEITGNTMQVGNIEDSLSRKQNTFSHNDLTGAYYNEGVGNVILEDNNGMFLLTFEDGMEIPLERKDNDTLIFSPENVVLKMSYNPRDTEVSIKFIENGYWAFTATKSL